MWSHHKMSSKLGDILNENWWSATAQIQKMTQNLFTCSMRYKKMDDPVTEPRVVWMVWLQL